MDSAVRYEGDAPAFYKRDLVLTTLVVDKQFVDMLGDDITYTIFYAGTSKCSEHQDTSFDFVATCYEGCYEIEIDVIISHFTNFA